MPRKFFKRNFQKYFVYSAVYLLIAVARILPRQSGMQVFSTLGLAASKIFGHDRRKALQNLSIAFPDMPLMVRGAVIAAMYKNLGRNIYEFLNLKGSTGARIEALISSVEGEEHLREAMAEGTGIIAITGHIGCWELLAAYLVSRGYSVSVVARNLRDAKWQEWVGTIRSSMGISIIDRDRGARDMLESLRNKEVLGVLMDQHTRVSGYYVPFFNKAAHTPSGVARLASISGAKIVPMAIYMNSNYQHVIRILKPISFPEDAPNRAWAVESVTAACARAMEDLIRYDPKQWIWWHDRWGNEQRETSYEVI
ncbi:MAG: lysophospholipid acyltransferase family protein [Candidatus Latescibacterota bacterium]